MRLRNLRVQGFTQIENIDLAFRDDAPNLIVGPNEAGKSHLMLALHGILFGLEHPERYTPWTGDPTMLGTLDFEDGAGNLVRLERQFAANQVTVIAGGAPPWSGKAGPKDKLPAALQYFQRVEGWLGFRDTRIFTATTFVQQSEVVQASMQGIAPQVKSLITGSGDADYVTVLNDLNKRIDDLRKKTPRMHPRRLEQKQDELIALEQRYREATTQHEKVAHLQLTRDHLTSEIKTTSALLIEKRRQLDRIGELVKREEDVAGVERRFQEQQDRLDRFEQQRKVLRQAESALNDCSRSAAIDKETLMRLDGNLSNAQTAVSTSSEGTEIASVDAAAIKALDGPVRDAESRVKDIESTPAVLEWNVALLTGLNGDVRNAQEQVHLLEKRGASPDLDPIELANLDGAVKDAEARLRIIEEKNLSAGRSVDPVSLGVAGLSIVIVLALTLMLNPLALILLVPIAALVLYRYRGGKGDGGATGKSVGDARNAVEQARQERINVLTRLGVESVEEAIKLRDRYAQLRNTATHAESRLCDALQRLQAPTVEMAIQLLRQYEDAQKALERAQQERSNALARLGAATVEDALARRRRYEVDLAKLTASESERDSVLQHLGVASIPDALAARQEYESADGAVREAHAALSALGDQDSVQKEWESVRRELSMKQAHVERLLDEQVALKLQTPAVRAAEAQRLLDAVDELAKHLENTNADKDRVDRELYIIHGAGEEDVAGLALAIAEVEADIARLELQVRALNEAIATLKDAVQEFQDNCLDGVTSTASELLATITGNRYTQVHLSDDSLEPRVDTLARPGIVVSDLSRGVRDQLYFSLRIALAEALAGGKILPLILDDPFVNFDSERLERTIDLLQHLVQRTQIVLFTCDPRYKHWIQPILELSRTDVGIPSAQTSGAA